MFSASTESASVEVDTIRAVTAFSNLVTSRGGKSVHTLHLSKSVDTCVKKKKKKIKIRQKKKVEVQMPEKYTQVQCNTEQKVQM